MKSRFTGALMPCDAYCRKGLGRLEKPFHLEVIVNVRCRGLRCLACGLPAVCRGLCRSCYDRAHYRGLAPGSVLVGLESRCVMCGRVMQVVSRSRRFCGAACKLRWHRRGGGVPPTPELDAVLRVGCRVVKVRVK